MLFSDTESYLLSDVASKCGYPNVDAAERELASAHIMGKPVGGTLAYHGRVLNEWILRDSDSHDGRGDEPPPKPRNQKRTPSGKFAATACPKCSSKMQRGKCPVCDS